MLFRSGGQASKSTPTGSIAKFAASGKKTRKKDLGMMAMSYGYVYVATVAMSANPAQLLKAMNEAEAYHGPSLIIAYAPCINHGINMAHAQMEIKRAVACGYWPLYRYNPELAEQGKNPLIVDSKDPTENYQDFIRGEVRYASLAKLFPAKAEEAYNTAFRTFKWQEAYDKAYDSVKDKKTMTADEKKEYATNAADEAQFAAAKKAYDEVVAKFGVNGLFDVAFVSKETVNKTGMTLASKMGITVKADNDKFMRPGTRWTYKSWSKFYMDTAKATYNTAVTVCDVLKAFGVAESDPTAITANVYTDGIKGLSNEDSFNAESHRNTARSCKKDTIGCQGVLTQVWKVGSEYRITEIHYFLAQVETVNKATHNKDVNSDIRVYFSFSDSNYVTPHNHRSSASELFNIDTADYAKDTWLVVTVSRIGNRSEEHTSELQSLV